MDYVVQLIEHGHFISLVGLALVLVFIGQFVGGSDAWSHAWGQRLAVLAFIAFCGYGIVTVGKPDATALFFVAVRGVLAAGLALGVSWNLLGAIAFVRSRSRDASAAAQVRATKRKMERERRKKEKEEEKQRRREQAEWERTAPERERTQLEMETRQREQQRLKDEAMKERQDMLVACESLFMLHAPDIRDRFGREEYDEFVGKYMGPSETTDAVQKRGKQLQQLIRDHYHKLSPPEKFHSLEELVTWYAEQKDQIESLEVHDSFRQDYLVQLNECYADLTQKVMENLAP